MFILYTLCFLSVFRATIMWLGPCSSVAEHQLRKLLVVSSILTVGFPPRPTHTHTHSTTRPSGRAVKAVASKATGLCPRRFESCGSRDFILYAGGYFRVVSSSLGSTPRLASPSCSRHSSVGRAVDCSGRPITGRFRLLSIGHRFDSGCRDTRPPS